MMTESSAATLSIHVAPLMLERDITVAGIFVRTQHERAMIDIPALWQRFGAGEVFAKVADAAHRAGGAPPYVYAVYCDYASDDQGPYTLVLGVEVPEGYTHPDLRTVVIASGAFASVTVSGDPARVIYSAWAHLNQVWDGKPSRRYGADFERYDPSSTATHCNAVVAVGVHN
jgi:predicted transcriptional regulator YdeE